MNNCDIDDWLSENESGRKVLETRNQLREFVARFEDGKSTFTGDDDLEAKLLLSLFDLRIRKLGARKAEVIEIRVRAVCRHTGFTGIQARGGAAGVSA